MSKEIQVGDRVLIPTGNDYWMLGHENLPAGHVGYVTEIEKSWSPRQDIITVDGERGGFRHRYTKLSKSFDIGERVVVADVYHTGRGIRTGDVVTITGVDKAVQDPDGWFYGVNGGITDAWPSHFEYLYESDEVEPAELTVPSPALPEGVSKESLVGAIRRVVDNYAMTESVGITPSGKCAYEESDVAFIIRCTEFLLRGVKQ